MAQILFLTQVLPYPLNTGAKIRAYYVLRQLTQRHDVTLVSFVREDDDPAFVEHLETFCRAVHPVPMKRSWWRDLRALAVAGLTGRSAIIVRDQIGEMHTKLERLMHTDRFDVVHADQTSMVQYALFARAQAHGQPKLILDAHNALYRIPRRMARHESNPLKRLLLQREARALARYEARAYRRFDHVVFVTEQDREALSTLAARNDDADGESELSSDVIPICVDPEVKPLVERVQSPRAVTHLGTMFWPPNIEGTLWFAWEVFPQVLEEAPRAQFVVVGKDPPREVRTLPMHVRNVEVTGYVPDPKPYLAETAVFIVPLRAGGGMRVKIVDAWCWGVPIVSTSIGAEGIAVEDGRNILIADTPAAMAEAVARVLDERALGERLRENGRQWVKQRYDWRQVYSRWNQVYEKLIATA
jgi:glycosyltransferase involved in cell wall biosynthesis